MCLHLFNIGHVIYVLDSFFDANSMVVSILGLDKPKKAIFLFYMFSAPFFNLNSTVMVIICVHGCLFMVPFT